MGHEFKACAECTEKCLLVHGNKRNASPVITTFVRVMFGNQFSKYMELPPNVACAVSLADQSTFIEDSRRLRWNVAISSIDGSFAFRHGWNAFSLDHDLQLGNILVFNYIKGSHFTVKIYDNSGCELKFFETNEKKRKRDHRDSIFKGGWCYAVDKSSMSKDDSGLCGCSDAEINKRMYEANRKGKAPITKQYASNCEAEYAEEMCDMINREYGDKQGENRAHILDLYDYEMPKKIKNFGSEGSNKMAVVNVTCCHNADSSLILRHEASSVRDPVVKEVATRVIPLDGSEFERTLKNSYCEVKVKKEEPSDVHSSIETSGHLFATLAVIPEENEETISAISTRATKKCRTADGSGGDEAISREKRFKSGHPTLVVIMQPSDLMNALKIDITFAKQYLCAPGSDCTVNLQIPNGSTWPTLCSVTEKENARIRYRGWMKFATDNGLQVGDACVLEMIKQLPHEITFLVHITRARPSYLRCM